MILAKFIKPKWQHPDPETRKAAVDSLDDFTILHDIAQHDESPIVRRVAVRKIEDLSLLNTIARQDADTGIRDLAQQRFRQLLCGQKEPFLPLDKRLSWLHSSTEIELLEYVAVNAKEAELRLAALTKVGREGLLGDIAINDQNKEVRLAAVEKLTQKSTLERVYKATRNLDKRVSRVARDKLDALLIQIERPERVRTECRAICTKLEALGHSGLWDQENTELKRLQERWQTLDNDSNNSPFKEEFLARFTKAQQTFVEAFTKHQSAQEALRLREQTLAPVRVAKRGLCEQVEALLTELQSLKRLKREEESEFNQKISAIQQQWTDTPILDERTEEQHWQVRFERAQQAVQRRLKDLQSVSKIAHTMESLCHRAETLLSGNTFIKSKQLQDLQEQWATIQSTQMSPLLHEFSSRFNSTLQALQNRVQQQKVEVEEAVKQVKQLLKDMETALEIGELHTAIPLEQKIRELFQKYGDLATSRYKALEGRWQKGSIKIRELQSWQRWGDNRERESLCEQVENLVERPDDNPEVTARLIREAQSAWKHLGTSGCPHELWERFNKACNAAYKPCHEYFAEQAKHRERNLTQRQSVCERLEKFASQVDWKTPNWKEIQHFIQEIDKNWRAIGPTDRRARKNVTNRFNAAMQMIQTHLDEEGVQNRQHRERLIEKAKAAQGIKDLGEAIKEVKHLQARWQVTIPGSRRDERQLWKVFRTACDVVFDRRRQQQEASQAELQAYVQTKTALCEQAEALANLQGEAIKTAPQQLKKLMLEWKESGSVGKKVGEAIEKRFEKAGQQVEKRYRAQLVAEQREQMELLKRKAFACTELEQATGIDVQALVTSAQAAWANLPPLLDTHWESTISQRFTQACAEVGQQPSINESALKARETQCIHMEILAGVDSPPEAVSARMAYQVARLSQAMSGGKNVASDKSSEAQQVEQEWYLNKAIPGEQGIRLEQRFSKACEAFYARHHK